MTKTLTAIAVAATLGLAAVAAPQQAEARGGGAVAAGVIGGLAAGAIIGSAAAHGPYYTDQPIMGPAPLMAATGPTAAFGTASAGAGDRCACVISSTARPQG